MSGVRKFVDKVLHSEGSSGRKPGGNGQPPDIQQPGNQGQQPKNQQSQLQERSSKGSVRNTLGSLSPFAKARKSEPEATATGHARPPSQSDTVVSGTLAPASGRIDITASSNTLIPPSRDPLATAIPAPNPPDIVITTISPINHSSQTPDPISAPPSDPQALSTVSQAVWGTNISVTKNSPSTVPPSISLHIWQKTLEIAQESLAKSKLPSLELGSLQSQSAAENMQSLVTELERE